MNMCNQCGSDIAENRKYCDKQCYGDAISNKESTICKYCDTEFLHIPSVDRKFCSEECRDSSRSTSVSVDCEHCGDSVTKQPNELERATNYYCSNKCKNEDQKLSTIECGYCKNTFKPELSERKYCSRQCSANSRRKRLTISCKNCSADVERWKYYVEKYNNIFCNINCRAEWLEDNSLFSTDNPNEKDGRYNGFGANWNEWREKILNRALGYCEYCGKTANENGRSLSVHHIEPRSSFINDENRVVEDSNNWDNLIALCRSCHSKAEHNKISVQ